MTSNAASLPLPDDANRKGEKAQETTPGGSRAVRWRTVARTMGLMPAHIIVGRLQSEGIPARAWQEGAGRATGLIVGKLGTGHVEVPEEFAAEAEQILATDVTETTQDDADWEQ